jgi:hypothetical protein
MKVKHQGRSVPALMKSEPSSMVELPVSHRREDFDKFLYSVIREEEVGRL